mgnify:CR=1 FL=1
MVGQIAGDLVTEQYRLLNDEIIPGLANEGIHFIRRDDWSEAQRNWLILYIDALFDHLGLVA